jgi:hypothetical protein
MTQGLLEIVYIKQKTGAEAPVFCCMSFLSKGDHETH